MTDKPQTFTVKPEGVVTVKKEADGSTAFSSDKPVSIDIKNILSFGVQNVIDIKTYQLENLPNSIRHFIEFHGGGTVTLEYSTEGKIIECSVKNLISEVSGGDRIIVKKK